MPHEPHVYDPRIVTHTERMMDMLIGLVHCSIAFVRPVTSEVPGSATEDLPGRSDRAIRY